MAARVAREASRTQLPTQGSENAPPRHSWQMFLLLGLLLAAVVMLACHPRHRHVDGVHSDADMENWCLQMHSEEITDDTARDRVNVILENSSLGWESRDEINLFSAGSIECHEAQDRSVYEIEVHIWDDVVEDGPCLAGHAACLRWISSVSTHGIDTDYDKVTIHLPVDEVMENGEQLVERVNHEAGHAFGLADPTAIPPFDKVDFTGQLCLVWQKVDLVGSFLVEAPVLSIMHQSRCPQVPFFEWPTYFDFKSFDENVR